MSCRFVLEFGSSIPRVLGSYPREDPIRPFSPKLLAALTAALLLVAAFHQASALTKTVCPPPGTCDYTTISGAVTGIPLGPGVTIEVKAGTYREQVTVDNKDGTASQRAVIRAIDAPGTVIIDGSDPFTDPTQWTLLSQGSSVYKAYLPPYPWTPPQSQVFGNGVRYTYKAPGSEASLLPGEYTKDTNGGPDSGWAYVNAGGQNPANVPIYISNKNLSNRARGFLIRNTDYLTIDGFNVIRCAEEGIRVVGTSSIPVAVPADTNIRSVVVTNCRSTQNWKRGIHVENCAECSIANDTTYDNGGHGIYLFTSTRCNISRNESYRNDKPDAVRGGVTGIKVGASPDSSNVSFVTVDYNSVHDNEDSGIDLAGAKRIIIRRNISYRNQDHGYDNNYTKHTVFLNNVATRNDHDGISVENTAYNVEVYNCILAEDAVNPLTLGSPGYVREMLVANGTGFGSDYNIVVALPSTDWVVGSDHYYRRAVEFPGGLRWATFPGYVDSTTGFDDHSRTSDPMFADSALGNFKVNSASSEALDRAKTDMASDPAGWVSPWWLSTDPRGFSPHDVAGVANAGSGTPAYADIGAFEFDPVPAAISDLNFDVDPVDCTKFWLSWAAPSDDVNLAASGPGTQYDMKSSSQSFSDWTPGAGTLGLAPAMAPTAQTWQVGVGFGQHRYFGIKTKDSNGQWSGPSYVVYISGPPADWTDCSEGGGTFAAGGGGGDGFRARPAAGPASVESAGATGLAENTLLNGVANGTPSTDLFRLPAITASGGNSYPVRIREASGHALSLDRVRLLTVDHSSSVRTFMATAKPVLGTRVAPAQAEDATGRDITARVDGSTTDAFTGDSGAVITVKLATDPAGSPDPVVIEASGLGWSSSGILVQVPDEANGWRTVGRVQPRLYVDELAVDSVASARVRLFLLGRHQVRFVGRVARSTERPTLQWAQLLKAQDSSLGDALSALSAGDTAAVTLVGPDTLMLSFAAPAMAEGQARECFLAVHGAPLLVSGALVTPLRASGMESTPTRFALRQNEPNPFSAATTIQFDLPAGAMARLEVFDIQGRLVRVVADHYFPAGEQAVQWDRRDEAGEAARPGVYLYRLAAGTFRAQKKMVLLP